MARARSPDSIKAEELYRTGMKLVEIAEKLGVPAGTVRRWKSTQDWEGKSKKKESERSEKEKANVRKRGGQKGNKNGVGNRGPVGYQNALKHGGYSTVYWDQLDEDEKVFIEDKQDDEEKMLIDQITLYSVRERRLMKAINKYKDSKGGVYMTGAIRQEQKRTFKDDAERELYEERIREKMKNGDRLPGESYGLQTQTSATIDLIARLERELTSVQSKKTKAIEALSRIRIEKAKMENEAAGNDVVDDWIAEVLKEDDADEPE